MMTVGYKYERRVTPNLIAFHKINAKRLRIAARGDARKMIHTWLTKIIRRHINLRAR